MAETAITGAIQVIGERIDTGNFSKRDVVIRTDEQYPQDISIQFTQDKCDILDAYKVGETVTIAYNLRGKLGGWTNPQGEVKYFSTIQAWRIQRPAGAAAPAQAPPANAAPAAQVYKHTDTFITYESYKAVNWTDAQLVANGKGIWVPSPAAAPAPAAAPTPPPAAAPADNPEDDLPF